MQIDWKKYFTDAFRLVNRPITEDQQVVMYAIDYLRKLNFLMKEYMERNKEKKL